MTPTTVKGLRLVLRLAEGSMARVSKEAWDEIARDEAWDALWSGLDYLERTIEFGEREADE